NRLARRMRWCRSEVNRIDSIMYGLHTAALQAIELLDPSRGKIADGDNGAGRLAKGGAETRLAVVLVLKPVQNKGRRKLAAEIDDHLRIIEDDQGVFLGSGLENRLLHARCISPLAQVPPTG